jgi:maltooligosyltrehalose trehalohydrolase
LSSKHAGARLTGGGVEFRVWAPKRKRVRVLIEKKSFDLQREPGGYFSCIVPSARAGTRYQFKLDSDDYLYPDPVSRYQPEGPHGASQVVDPAAFQWSDVDWPGVQPRNQIIYEFHVGTFTPEGTWNAARAQLRELASIGITMLEMMPIAEFAGRRGWGYDGVDLFAPFHHYGEPDDLRRFIDEAHGLGLAVILDVVYNHLGPDGNYLKAFAGDYFTDKYSTDWGESINFTPEPVREFYLLNAAYWIEEYHFDGLRLDATQDIHDTGPEHILAALTKRVRAAAGARSVYIVAENEPQDTTLVRPLQDRGFGMDALWNDDFHHSAIVALTGRSEAYYTDYRGKPQEFISAAKHGYLFQGQWYMWQKERRGTPALELAPWHFVTFIQNHDQLSNSAWGERPNLLTGAAQYRAMTALFMLSPGTPMLFQGQEFGATTPFLFFCDHEGELSRQVYEGRKKYLRQFRSLAQPEIQNMIPDPGDKSTFDRSKLDLSEGGKSAQVYQLYKDLIHLRQHDPVFRAITPRGVDGAVIGDEALVLRYFSDKDGDRLLLVNFGRDMHFNPSPEPLLGPPWKKRWAVLWSSEDPAYGGSGTFPPDSAGNWRLPGLSAVVVKAVPARAHSKTKAGQKRS